MPRGGHPISFRDLSKYHLTFVPRWDIIQLDKGLNEREAVSVAVWVGLGALALLVGAVFLQARTLARCRFWCPSCGRLFALPWTKLLFRQHINEEWRLTCPHCGQKGWCPARRPYRGGDNP